MSATVLLPMMQLHSRHVTHTSSLHCHSTHYSVLEHLLTMTPPPFFMMVLWEQQYMTAMTS
ncbi:hypothetical protein ACHAW6_000551 [Cyclotella cf. meneghiniana]